MFFTKFQRLQNNISQKSSHQQVANRSDTKSYNHRGTVPEALHASVSTPSLAVALTVEPGG